MDKYNGYKLKPSSYQIQPNDIIIKVKNGRTRAPIGTLGVALGNDWVSFPTQSQWSTNYPDWRAIETKPGSEAKVGDTVYCIRDTGGACKEHDLFIVNDITTTRSAKFLGPQQGHTLLNKKITEKNWGWLSNDFVVLVKADSVSEFPCFRKSLKTKVVVKFTAPSKGTVVEEGESILKLGTTCTWTDYRNTDIWAPCEDPSNQEVSAESFIPFTIIDMRGNERTCVRLSKDNWYVSENPNGNKSHHNPLFWIKKENANATSSTSPDTITTVSIDSMMNKPTQTKPNTKGKQMNSSLFTDMLKLLTQVEQTDLQKAPSAYAFFYNEDGEYEGTAKVANEAEAKALLQRPEHLGYTMRIYSFSDEFTTYMPVVSTIKKTVEANPTKPVRKPRAPKVK